MEQDDTSEVQALVAEIMATEHISREAAVAHAAALFPWLAPFTERWNSSVLAAATHIAQPLPDLEALSAVATC